MLCTRQSAAHVRLIKAGGRRRDWDLAQGQNNYDLSCGCVVDDTLFVGGRECELTRWDLETRQPSWKVSDPASCLRSSRAMMKALIP